MEQNLSAAGLLLLIGLSITFLCLILLSGMIWSFKTIDERVNNRRIRRYNEKVEATPDSDEVNDEIAAVIAAAVTAAIRRPVIVRRVRFLDSSKAGQWAVTGRLDVMASHAITRRKS